ncbi:MAG: dTDP-4-dehydrorhamnose 3,5-epimerase family protein [Actinomycetes bacterium]
MEPLGIDGAWVHTPVVHRDDRGSFQEWFRGAEFAAALGHRLGLAQANMSVSRRGVVRGIHFADVPPGQAKYVTCARGAALDVVVDIRVGSPTYGRWEAVQLDEEDRRAVYLGEGLGHAFCALTDETTVVYLCSTPYAAEREHGIDPMDPEIGIEWPAGITPVLSGKDAEAPGLSAARDAGLLPSYGECKAYVSGLE